MHFRGCSHALENRFLGSTNIFPTNCVDLYRFVYFPDKLKDVMEN